MMNSARRKEESKIMKKCINNIIKAPMNVLRKVRKIYRQIFSGCGEQIGYVAYGSVGAYPGPHLTTNLPRGASSSTAVDNNDDLRELIKAASIREKKKKMMMKEKEASESELLEIRMIDHRRKQQQPPRSQSSVAIIGRIDEEGPCEFESVLEDVTIKVKRDFYRKSRSYAAVPPKPRV